MQGLLPKGRVEPRKMTLIRYVGLDGEMTGTWLYLPLGSEGVELAVRVLSDQKIPRKLVLPSPMIHRANVQEYYDPATRKRKVAPVKLPI